MPTNLASPSVAEAARRPPSSSKVGRLASSDSIEAGGFTPGAILAERYRIIGLLGRGGMGEVYRADDLKLGQPVALKFLPRHLASDKDRLERFYAEVRIARQVSHPNVCRVYDVAEIDGQQYLSMEYVDGEDLASLLKRIGRLPADKALDISRELCAGLAAAHERGVLHRDLKPANVMIDGRGRARITDFGLAVAAGDVVDGEVSGTPAYMAPEQLAGKGATVRSDVYALGLVLYELYTGRKAFEGATFQELKRKHAEDPPASPSTISPGFDPVVERVILRCLEKDPAARPASASQVAAALPGGDPLAAALAAGETPSPEMVAAAGEQGALAPRLAWTLLSATLAAFVGIIVLSRWSSDQGVAPFPRSPAVLEDKARELAAAVGDGRPPADTAAWWLRQYPYLVYRAASIPSTRNFRELARAEPHPWWFVYRQSPRPLVPLNGGQFVRVEDPPFEVSGMVTIALDARGNLMSLRVEPPQVDAAGRGRRGRETRLEAALRRRRPRPEPLHAVGAPMASERAFRRARGLGRLLCRNPGRADPRRRRFVARKARLVRGHRPVEAADARGRESDRGRPRRARRGDRVHPLHGSDRDRFRRASQSPAGSRRPPGRVPRRGLHVHRLSDVLAVRGAPRERHERGVRVALDGLALVRIHGRIRLAHLRRDRADRPAEVAGPADLLEPAARREVPRSARRAATFSSGCSSDPGSSFATPAATRFRTGSISGA